MSSPFTSFSYSLKDRLSRALDQIQMNNGSAPGSPKSSPFRRGSENKASDIGTLYAKDLLPYPNGTIERTEEFLLRIVEILLDHVRKTNDRSCKILDFHHPEQLKEILDFEIPDEPQNLDQILVDCKDTLKYQVKTGHPRFFNQLSSGLDLVCMAGEWLTATANSNMFTYEISPVFVLMEQVTLRKMLDVVGYPNGDGIFAPGGTLSNLYALHAARYKRFPEIKTKGMHAVPKLAIFTSEHSHYSIKGAGAIMGLGTDNVILVKCDDAGRMIPNELEDKILEAKRRGFCPFFASATAGTTVYGAFDPIHPIADICQKYSLWLHVDAAWGGGALLSNKYRGRMDGIERADSVTWNPHKLMGALLQCSAVLLKEDGLLFSCNQMCADYLYQQDKHYEVSYDTGDRAIQCGRHVDVFKLWLMWRSKGMKGFEKHIDWLFELTQYLVDRIKERDDFELLLEPECTNVCFWYVPPSCRNMPQGPERQKKLGVLTAKIKGKMMESGTLMIGYQPLGDIPNFFRLIFSNAAVTKEDVDFMIEEIDRLGRQF